MNIPGIRHIFPALKFSTICNEIIICSLFIRLRKGFRQNWRLFVVKPVLIFYGVQYAVTGNITTQLWLDRTCRVVFNFNETVCSNLTDERWIEFENKVQAQVNIASETIHLFSPPESSLWIDNTYEKGYI